MRLFPRAIALSLALLLSGTAAADDSVAEVRGWLDRMSRALETLNFRGTLVHLRDGEVDTLGIVHRADENGIRERIFSLDGEPREILRDGNQVRCLLAGNQPLVVQSQLAARLMPNLPINRLGSPESAYRMSMGGRERVAGMMTRIVEIQPLDEFRYGHRFWLEERTGMLLRSALLDHKGRRLQQLSFVTIELGVPISDAELSPSMEQYASVEATIQAGSTTSQSDDLRRASWVPPRLPDNFTLARAGRNSTGDGEVFEHLVFSDGLASFSVYLEEGLHGYGGSRLEVMGPVHVYTGVQDGRKITVVGEVPRATVEYVGRSLRRSPGPRSRN
jgi:sigma-E factor negative regulatory protein RseB